MQTVLKEYQKILLKYTPDWFVNGKKRCHFSNLSQKNVRWGEQKKNPIISDCIITFINYNALFLFFITFFFWENWLLIFINYLQLHFFNQNRFGFISISVKLWFVTIRHRNLYRTIALIFFCNKLIMKYHVYFTHYERDLEN